MPDNFRLAMERAKARIGDMQWFTASPAERSALTYHELCRLDSGCQRTGAESDALLPPCRASATFIARRACAVAGPAETAEQTPGGWRSSDE